ncbi:ketosteroid isomerase-like protein [Azospirillum agricola]|uniref:nuclear transport factor 2 family protein n=1 Tax=Azospirillum agricola TaxID=1720247 RepID=UPI001AE246FD|nr:nuclear transport factor 2 family protein [Azospirillum agricola]MBP2227862.1 ketosteroid isomerase-like protein [Azospirillum agricola]
MAQTDIDLLRDLYQRYSVGDIAPLFERLAPDVEWVSGHRSPALASFSGTFHGPGGVRRYFEGLARDWTITRHDMRTIGEEDGRIVARNRVEAVNNATGKPVEVTTEHRWILRDGLIQRFEERCDDEALLEAACPPCGP